MSANPETKDIGSDLKFRSYHGASDPEIFVSGSLNGHTFTGRVIQEHAENPDLELGRSYLIRLHVQRTANQETVFLWHRGPKISAKDGQTQAIVD
jgi:hypothetical protein